MKDLYNNSEQIALFPANIYNTNTNGETVDLKGEGRKCMIMASVGQTSTATVQITIQGSLDDSSWGTIISLSVGNSTTGLEVVDFATTMRYIRAICTLATQESGRTDVIFGVAGVFYNLRYIPEHIGTI